MSLYEKHEVRQFCFNIYIPGYMKFQSHWTNTTKYEKENNFLKKSLAQRAG